MFGRRSTEPEPEGRYHVELVEGTAPVGNAGAFEPQKERMYYKDAQGASSRGCRAHLGNVLVVCPKALVSKLRMEMRRFDEDFRPLNADNLRYCLREAHLDGVWPAQYTRHSSSGVAQDGGLHPGRQQQTPHRSGREALLLAS